MAKNDYYVIAYKILHYLYEAMKSGEQPDRDMISPDALGINNAYWANVMQILIEEGYVTGATVLNAVGSCKGIKLTDLRITLAGIDYLEDNSKINKAKEFLKEVKSIIPGL
jgi:hypothetical protein